MAAGDTPTLDGGSNPIAVGNRWLLTGTIEVDDTYRAFALAPATSNIISCMLQCEGGAGTAECDLNVNASGTATLGTIAVAGNHVSTNTYRFQAYIGGF